MTGDPHSMREGRQLVLLRARRSAVTMGLKAGDVLFSVDGTPPLGEKRLPAGPGADGLPPLLGLMRDGEPRFVRAIPRDLGRWRDDKSTLEREGLPEMPLHALNWEVWTGGENSYDALRSRPGLEAAFVPFYLAKMRLWEPLALWGAIVVLSMMLGVVLGTLVQLSAWLLFWRVAPDLVRKEWVAQGLRPGLVLAAPSERVLHSEVARLLPQLRFRHARSSARPSPA